MSVALWLLAAGVHPQHSEQFANARLLGCDARAASLAELAPGGVALVGANAAAGRALCEGFDEEEHVKRPGGARAAATRAREAAEAALVARLEHGDDGDDDGDGAAGGAGAVATAASAPAPVFEIATPAMGSVVRAPGSSVRLEFAFDARAALAARGGALAADEALVACIVVDGRADGEACVAPAGGGAANAFELDGLRTGTHALRARRG